MYILLGILYIFESYFLKISILLVSILIGILYILYFHPVTFLTC